MVLHIPFDNSLQKVSVTEIYLHITLCSDLQSSFKRSVVKEKMHALTTACSIHRSSREQHLRVNMSPSNVLVSQKMRQSDIVASLNNQIDCKHAGKKPHVVHAKSSTKNALSEQIARAESIKCLAHKPVRRTVKEMDCKYVAKKPHVGHTKSSVNNALSEQIARAESIKCLAHKPVRRTVEDILLGRDWDFPLNQGQLRRPN